MQGVSKPNCSTMCRHNMQWQAKPLRYVKESCSFLVQVPWFDSCCGGSLFFNSGGFCWVLLFKKMGFDSNGMNKMGSDSNKIGSVPWRWWVLIPTRCVLFRCVSQFDGFSSWSSAIRVPLVFCVLSVLVFSAQMDRVVLLLRLLCHVAL